MQDNVSLKRHYAIPLLPAKPKEGTCKICASVIIDLTQTQELNNGVDIHHDTAIHIAKQTGLWNFLYRGTTCTQRGSAPSFKRQPQHVHPYLQHD